MGNPQAGKGTMSAEEEPESLDPDQIAAARLRNAETTERKQGRASSGTLSTKSPACWRRDGRNSQKGSPLGSPGYLLHTPKPWTHFDASPSPVP